MSRMYSTKFVLGAIHFLDGRFEFNGYFFIRSSKRRYNLVFPEKC